MFASYLLQFSGTKSVCGAIELRGIVVFILCPYHPSSLFEDAFNLWIGIWKNKEGWRFASGPSLRLCINFCNLRSYWTWEILESYDANNVHRKWWYRHLITPSICIKADTESHGKIDRSRCQCSITSILPMLNTSILQRLRHHTIYTIMLRHDQLQNHYHVQVFKTDSISVHEVVKHCKNCPKKEEEEEA